MRQTNREPGPTPENGARSDRRTRGRRPGGTATRVHRRSAKGGRPPGPSAISADIAIGVVASSADGTGTVIPVQLSATYRAIATTDGETTALTGELHKVPWSDYLRVIGGMQAALDDLLGFARGSVTMSSTMPARAGMATAAFLLRIPRSLSDEEHERVNLCLAAYSSVLQSESYKIEDDLFLASDPAAGNIGKAMAEAVRRKVKKRSLPEGLKLPRAGGIDRLIEKRIADHPDPEQDKGNEQIEGQVFAINTRRHLLEVESYVLVPQKSKDGTDRAPKRKRKSHTIRYSPTRFEEQVLALPLGRKTAVKMTVSRTEGRGQCKLRLVSLDD